MTGFASAVAVVVRTENSSACTDDAVAVAAVVVVAAEPSVGVGDGGTPCNPSVGRGTSEGGGPSFRFDRKLKLTWLLLMPCC